MMEYWELIVIVWLYIFGAAGWGAAIQSRDPKGLEVLDFLMIVSWFVSLPIFLILHLIFREIRG